MAWAEVYLHTNWHPNPSNRLATIGVGRKVGGDAAVPLSGAGGSLSNSVASGVLINTAVWPQYMGRKVGLAVLLLFGVGSWVPI